MFKKISLKIKLVTAFLATASLVVLLSYFNVQAIRSIHGAFDTIVDSHVQELVTLQEMRVLAGEVKTLSVVYEQSGANDGLAEQQKNELLASLEKLTDQESRLLALVPDDDQLKVEQITSARKTTFNTVFELVSLKESNASSSLIDAKNADLIRSQAALESALAISIEESLANIGEQDEVADNQVGQLISTGMLISALSAAFALFLGILISFSIVRRLRELREGSERIANGDFSHAIPVKSQDEIGMLASDFNKMSARLQASYQRLAFESKRDETVLESMSDGLIALDPEGKIVLMNSVAADLFAFDHEGRPIGRLFDKAIILKTAQDKAIAAEQSPGRLALQTDELDQETFSYSDKDEHKTLINISASPVVVDTHIAGAILVLRDVTREKEIDRMKTEFISLASHQLRTPLSAIKWFSEMLLSGDAGKLEDEQQEFAKNISDSTERMIQLVNALLNISRIESGRIIVDPKPTDLKELVGGIVNDLTAKTKEKEQSLVISVHSELPKINLDPHLIGQVYLNLLTNAIKYTPKGGEIMVFISKKGDEVVSQVTDNGYGIPKSQQDRVFQKFFRAENITKHETDGTGLGLYLIKSIIESSNGKIWYESEENKGTTFWFSLPMSGMKPKEGEVSLDI